MDPDTVFLTDLVETYQNVSTNFSQDYSSPGITEDMPMTDAPSMDGFENIPANHYTVSHFAPSTSQTQSSSVAATRSAEILVPIPQFHLFSRLPVEIQITVFDYMLPDPQVITIIGEKIATQPDGRKIRITCDPPQPLYKIPVIFHVCRGWREFAMTTYPPLFEERLEIPIFFNTAQDTLFFIDEQGLRRFFRSTTGALYNMKGITGLVRHLMFASGVRLDSRTLQDISCMELATLSLEKCNPGETFLWMHKENSRGSDKLLQYVNTTYGEMLLSQWREIRGPDWNATKVKCLTIQEMYNASDLGKDCKPEQELNNTDLMLRASETFPNLAWDTYSKLASHVYPPIFNGMNLPCGIGYYTQQERLKRFEEDVEEGNVSAIFNEVCGVPLFNTTGKSPLLKTEDEDDDEYRNL